jgi:hypothetical protein
MDGTSTPNETVTLKSKQQKRQGKMKRCTESKVRLEQATPNPWSERDEDESDITRSSGQGLYNPASCCSPTDNASVIQGTVGSDKHSSSGMLYHSAWFPWNISLHLHA